MNTYEVTVAIAHGPLSPELLDQDGGQDAMAILLLVLLLKILALGGIFLFMAFQVIRQKRKAIELEADLMQPHYLEKDEPLPVVQIPSFNSLNFNPPTSWMAIRSTDQESIENALELKDASRCNYEEGSSLDNDHDLFIAPPTAGWTLVFGGRLRNFAEDPSHAFHFFRRISSALGNVQYFSVNPVVNHHCWVNADQGNILRAYNWNGSTTWNQGPVTRAEKELKMTLLDYGDDMDNDFSNPFSPQPDARILNGDKIYQLAGFWGVNPLTIDLSGWQDQEGIRGTI